MVAVIDQAAATAGGGQHFEQLGGEGGVQRAVALADALLLLHDDIGSGPSAERAEDERHQRRAAPAAPGRHRGSAPLTRGGDLVGHGAGRRRHAVERALGQRQHAPD